MNAGVGSVSTTLAAGGPVGGDFRLRLAGYRIVGANGDDIQGASLESDLLNPVPEPTSLVLSAAAVALGLRRGPRRPQ